MMAALNIAYEEPESRSLFRYYLNAFTSTIIGILGGVVMLSAILYVPILFAFAGYSHAFELVVRVARWPSIALFVLFMLAVLYRYGPCRRTAKWHSVSVGSLFAMVVWLIASAAFSFYVSNFANYDRLYGSLGAVIILLFWLYTLVLHRSHRRGDQCRARAADGQGHDRRQTAPYGGARRLRRRPRGRWT